MTSTRIQIKRGTAASWTAANPILSQGELGLETDTSKVKIGNGSAAWNSLGYFPVEWGAINGKPTVIAAGSTQAAARTAIDAEYTGNKGQANGYAELNSSAKVPLSQLPPGIVIDNVDLSGETLQFYSGATPIGNPIALVLSTLDGGVPQTTTTSSQTAYVDGGAP